MGIGDISEVHLFREAYVGAIYNHFGKQYRVTVHGAKKVELEDEEAHRCTEGTFWTFTQYSEILAGYRYGEALAGYFGRLTVYENVEGFKEIDVRPGEVVREKRRQLARKSDVKG